jgi:hypothetical protein
VSPLTGGFDGVMEVRGAALARIAREMHGAGSIQHLSNTVHDGHLLTTQLGCPAVELVPSTSPELQVTATTRALCRARPLDDATALGGTAVATIVFRGRLVLPPGDPSPIQRDDALQIDWSQTAPGDVTVDQASDAQTATLVHDALAAQAAEAGAAAFNVGLLTEAGITSAALHALPPGSGPTGTLAIALNLFGTSGSRAGIAEFVDGDWALALSADLVVGRVREALKRQLGALPPPDGAGPLHVGDQEICLLPTALGCAIPGTAVIWLDALTMVLTAQGLELHGALRQEVVGMPLATVTASWSSTVALSVAADGSLHATASPPAVSVQSWIGQVANLLSAGALETAVKDAVAGVLLAGLGTTDPTQLLALLLGEFASAGRTAGATVEPRALRVETRPDGVIVHGTLLGSAAAPPPHAQLEVVGTADPGRVLLAADASWVPAGDVATVAWSLGDGTTQTTSGPGAALVLEHTYAAGTYTAAVTITGASGASATAHASLAPGRLALRHIVTDRYSQVEWEQCGDAIDPVAIELEVTTCGYRLAGVDVTAEGSGWSVAGVTDARGRVELQLSVDDVRKAPAPGTLPAFGIGAVTIRASRTGFDPATERLTLMDCGGLFKVIEAAKRAREETLDRLAGYAALAELRTHPPAGTTLGDVLAPPGVGIEPRPRPPVSDPVLRSLHETRVLVAALDAITHVVESGGPAAAGRLLGVHSADIPAHLTKLWATVAHQAGALDAQLHGGGPDRPGRPGMPDR